MFGNVFLLLLYLNTFGWVHNSWAFINLQSLLHCLLGFTMGHHSLENIEEWLPLFLPLNVWGTLYPWIQLFVSAQMTLNQVPSVCPFHFRKFSSFSIAGKFPQFCCHFLPIPVCHGHRFSLNWVSFFYHLMTILKYIMILVVGKETVHTLWEIWLQRRLGGSVG